MYIILSYFDAIWRKSKYTECKTIRAEISSHLNAMLL